MVQRLMWPLFTLCIRISPGMSLILSKSRTWFNVTLNVVIIHNSCKNYSCNVITVYNNDIVSKVYDNYCTFLLYLLAPNSNRWFRSSWYLYMGVLFLVEAYTVRLIHRDLKLHFDLSYSIGY